jgi:hypothetical protein
LQQYDTQNAAAVARWPLYSKVTSDSLLLAILTILFGWTGM